MDPAAWFSILPSLLAILVAAITRQVLPALLIGLWFGSFLLTPGFLASINGTLNRIAQTLSDRSNLDVILFLYVFSGFVALIQAAGGVKGFARWIERWVRSKKGALLTSWLFLPLSFIDCGFRVVATGAVMKPLARDHKISPERLAYMLNNSASPVIALVPIATTFIGYMLSVITSGMQTVGMKESAYSFFLRTIPFNFFSLTSVLVALASIFFPLQFSAMRQAEKGISGGGRRGKSEKSLTHEGQKRADAAKDQSGNAMKTMDMGMGMDMESRSALKPRAFNLLLPVGLVIVLSFALIVVDGWAPGRGLVAVFAEANASRMMLVAIFLTTVFAGALFLLQGLPLKLMVDRFVHGGNKLMVTILILALAWPIATVSKDLGLPHFVASTLGNSLPSYVVPVVAFLVTGAVTYAVGSSWGAWALMMPLAFSLAAASGSSEVLAAAAVFSGGTFGDVTSPLSGMTAMSAGIAEAEHMSYVRAMTPYNLLAAALAAILFAVAPWFS